MCLPKKTFLQARFSESWLDDFGDLLMVSFWDSKPYSCYKGLFPNQEWEGVSLVWTHSYMTMNLPIVSCETYYEPPNPCFLIKSAGAGEPVLISQMQYSTPASEPAPVIVKVSEMACPPLDTV